MPVRAAMEAEGLGHAGVETLEVTLNDGDAEWIVRVEGRSETGRASDRGASLLLLSFARAREPDRRLLEALVPARQLDDLHPGQLRAALSTAGPYVAEWRGRSFFGGTRKGGR